MPEITQTSQPSSSNTSNQDLVSTDSKELDDKVLDRYLSEEDKTALTPAQIALVKKTLQRSLGTFTPMACKGRMCPYAGTCPLGTEVNWKGKPCLVEAHYVAEAMDRYVHQLNIRDTDFANLSMVRELVEMEVISMRAKRWMATHPDIVMDEVVGVTRQGEEVSKTVISPAITVLEITLKRRQRMLDDLVATRRAILNAQQGGGDPSKATADLIEALREKFERDAKTIDISDVYPEDDNK